MSKRRATRDSRCELCKVNIRWCFCDRIQKWDNQTRVSIIMHHRERFLTSNTALLTERLLKKCDISLHGHLTKPFDFKLLSDHIPLLLFPHEDAVTLDEHLTKNFPKKPIQLIIPDGSWRQAKKFHRRIPILKDIQCVKLAMSTPSEYTLRTQSNEAGLCTIEAIARALGFIESKELEEHLTTGLRVMNERMDVSRNSELWQKELKY